MHPRCISGVRRRFFFIFLCFGWTLIAAAQANSWIGGASGNWEDIASWSLGQPPGTNESIYITNAGWKAVAINPNTVANYPQAMTVNSITVSSPTNSSNTLLMNYAGTQTPLTAQTITVASNSALTLFSSALNLNGPTGSGMSIGGEVDQNDSIVSGNAVAVGNIGPGVYNLNSGTFTMSDLFIEGSGVFNQNGGTNTTSILHLDSGQYVFSNGVLNAAVYFYGGTFRQRGGTLSMDANISNGSYALEGGEFDGNMVLPTGSGNASVLQTGGTNSGSLQIGQAGWGTYTMSNGVLHAASISVGVRGSFTQYDGQITVTGAVSASQGQVSPGFIVYGVVTLGGGALSAAAMNIDGNYTQTGGTNIVGGDITIYPDAHGFLNLSGGLLCDNNVNVGASWVGGYNQSGGVHIVTNLLSIGGNTFALWNGFTLSGGQLIVSNLALTALAKFTVTGGTILQSGTFSISDANLSFGSGSWQLGPMQLAGSTNSFLTFLSNSCLVQFAASSSLAWSNAAVLTISNWHGSLYGGGIQRIVFGNSSSALTSQQLSQIYFQSPAGLAAGSYPTRILPTGEIVPNSGASLPPLVALANQPSGAKQISVQGDIGSNYVIQISSDLLHWTPWTNRVNTNGTISVIDTAATNYPARFYRAVQLP